MRTTLLVWLCAFGLGVATSSELNAGPPAPQAAPPQSVRITVKNFGFEPVQVTVKAGTEVEWVDELGRHTVQADDGSFKSEILTAGGTFKHKFDKPGKYGYFCRFHGAAGGHDMAGTVIVE